MINAQLHMSGKVEGTQSAEPKSIEYHNKAIGGVDTMDKMLGEYQWRILRVFKVFSEHPDISKKILFSNFFDLFYFL